MKTISVVAAIILREGADAGRQVLSTQRGYGDWKGWWEFPGGKVEEGEAPEAALEREIREELACQIQVGEYLGTIEYDYPDFHLSMRCYACSLADGEPELLEHESAAWLSAGTLRSVKWLPADLLILDKVAALLARPPMTLERLPYALSVCKLSGAGDLSRPYSFFFAARTDTELSLVCRTEEVPAGTIAREDGWRAFRIAGTLDFSLVGILSRITGVLADGGIGLFAVSTYDTDYVLVRDADFARAADVLSAAGYDVV